MKIYFAERCKVGLLWKQWNSFLIPICLIRLPLHLIPAVACASNSSKVLSCSLQILMCTTIEAITFILVACAVTWFAAKESAFICPQPSYKLPVGVSRGPSKLATKRNWNKNTSLVYIQVTDCDKIYKNNTIFFKYTDVLSNWIEETGISKVLKSLVKYLILKNNKIC